MLEEDRELFIRKIGKDVQDEKMIEGRTLMLIGVLVGVILTILGFFLGYFLNLYIFIVLGVGILLIIASTTIYYLHRKSWEKKSFQVIGYDELDRVRKKIRDNDISDNHSFALLSDRERLIYYTYDLDYLHVIDEHDETRDVDVKVKGKIEKRPKVYHVKTFELTYIDKSTKIITSDNDYFNDLIIDFIYKEPVKATDGLIRAE